MDSILSRNYVDNLTLTFQSDQCLILTFNLESYVQDATYRATEAFQRCNYQLIIIMISKCMAINVICSYLNRCAFLIVDLDLIKFDLDRLSCQ